MKHPYSGVVVPLMVLLPIFIAFIKYKQLNAIAKSMLAYVLLSGLLSLVIIYLKTLHVKNNLPVFHLGTLLEFLVLCEFYKRVLPKEKYIPLAQIIFIIACVANSIFFQSIFTFNSYTRSLEAILILVFSINYFAKLFTDISTVKLIDQSTFWFNTAIFLYFSGSNMLFIFSNYIVTIPSNQFFMVWNMHATFLLLLYLLFTIGFLKCKK